MAKIKGLHHNAYRCRDSGETRAFYEDFLGLRLALLGPAEHDHARARLLPQPVHLRPPDAFPADLPRLRVEGRQLIRGAQGLVHERSEGQRADVQGKALPPSFGLGPLPCAERAPFRVSIRLP